jgi:hypothetical protein
MAWNRCGGYPTPNPSGEDHRTCPVCGWIPCLHSCRLGLTQWDVEIGLAALQDMDPPVDYGRGFPIGDEPFLPPQEPEDFVDEGDFEP